MNNLEPLLKELGCKTPAEEIASDRRDMILDFLKMESEYRRQHKIKRLLSLSGLKHLKTLDQFDWLFNPKISKDDILTFVNAPWIENAFNLVLIGDTGLGNPISPPPSVMRRFSGAIPRPVSPPSTWFPGSIRRTTQLPKSITMPRSGSSASMSSVIRITKRRIRIPSFRSYPKETRSSPRSSPPTSHPKSGARSSALPPHLPSWIV